MIKACAAADSTLLRVTELAQTPAPDVLLTTMSTDAF